MKNPIQLIAFVKGAARKNEPHVDQKLFPVGSEIDGAGESRSRPSAIVSREALEAHSRRKPRKAEIW